MAKLTACKDCKSTYQKIFKIVDNDMFWSAWEGQMLPHINPEEDCVASGQSWCARTDMACCDTNIRGHCRFFEAKEENHED